MKEQGSGGAAGIAVFYLARGAEENAPALYRRFQASYTRFTAGIDHDLLVIFKGYSADVDHEKSGGLFEGLCSGSIHASDDGFDLGSYYAAAAQVHHDYVCFLNTASELQSDAWLLKLFRNLELPGVGIVGASGSYEAPPPSGCRFPNIHVRTNAFMMRRSDFLASRPEANLSDKLAVYQVEHGPAGLTRRLRERGLQSLVVGRDGRGYSPEFWPISETFRQGEQSNLMVRDKQTEAYRSASPSRKQWLFAAAWGNGEVMDELLFADRPGDYCKRNIPA